MCSFWLIFFAALEVCMMILVSASSWLYGLISWQFVPGSEHSTWSLSVVYTIYVCCLFIIAWVKISKSFIFFVYAMNIKNSRLMHVVWSMPWDCWEYIHHRDQYDVHYVILPFSVNIIMAQRVYLHIRVMCWPFFVSVDALQQRHPRLLRSLLMDQTQRWWYRPNKNQDQTCCLHAAVHGQTTTMDRDYFHARLMALVWQDIYIQASHQIAINFNIYGFKMRTRATVGALFTEKWTLLFWWRVIDGCLCLFQPLFNIIAFVTNSFYSPDNFHNLIIDDMYTIVMEWVSISSIVVAKVVTCLTNLNCIAGNWS